jgi:1,2-dihydroxy-3-keto-5-methylthiopentene dioxygenase
MSWLAVIPEGDPERRLSRSSEPRAIAMALERLGVRFERWPPPLPGAEPLVAYASQIERLRAEGYGTIDVVSVAPDATDPGFPEKARAMREKFRDEHTHAEDEVRFFTSGAGLFYLRLDGNVYTVLCEAGDLLSVPAGTRHWFDMGLAPRFSAIRFFRSADGWVGNFTSDSIARRFPTFDELVLEARGASASNGAAVRQ